jgi:hypothetical protein
MRRPSFMESLDKEHSKAQAEQGFTISLEAD